MDVHQINRIVENYQTKICKDHSPDSGGWWGPSPGALAHFARLGGSQEEPKHGRTSEEAVSTYIQNCLSTREHLHIAANLLSAWEPLWGPILGVIQTPHSVVAETSVALTKNAL